MKSHTDFEGRRTCLEMMRQFVDDDTLPATVRFSNEFISEWLPSKRGAADSKMARATLEKFGLKFVGVVPGRPMFQFVELPCGWKKVPNDEWRAGKIEGAYSKLIDEKGRERAEIFYYVQPMCSTASMRLTTRFSFCVDMKKLWFEKVLICNVIDGGNKVIYTTHALPSSRGKKHEIEVEKGLKEVENWLNDNYPDWKNPSAYWDSE